MIPPDLQDSSSNQIRYLNADRRSLSKKKTKRFKKGIVFAVSAFTVSDRFLSFDTDMISGFFNFYPANFVEFNNEILKKLILAFLCRGADIFADFGNKPLFKTSPNPGQALLQPCFHPTYPCGNPYERSCRGLFLPVCGLPQSAADHTGRTGSSGSW